MNKRSLTKNNKPKKVANIYSGLEDFKGLYKKESIGNTLLGDAATLTGAIQGGIEAAEVDTSKADNAIEAVSTFQPMTSTLDALANSYNNVNLAKTDWTGSDFTKSTGEQLAGFGSDVLGAVGSSGGNWIKGVVDLGARWISRGIGWGAGAAKAKNEANRLNKEAELANISAHNKALSARDSILENETNEFMRNIISYGGPLYNHTGDWSNGLTFINEGGTHEENPFDGVLMGFDQEGVPNLVEEGEIIYNDYVFSNRLKPSKKQLESSGLNKKYNDWTFAKIVEDLQKTSAETPLDKISKESLDDMMTIMINMQEEVRMKKGLTGQNKLMANGGNLFAGGGPAGIDPYLTKVDISDITKAASEKLKFYNEHFVPDTFKDLPDVTPSNKLGTMSTIPYMTSTESAIQKKAIPDTSIKEFDDYINTEVQNRANTKNKKSFVNWNAVGQALPIISNAAKAIYNAATPIDYSNIIAEQAYRETPIMSLPRLGGKQVYRGIDRNRLTNPIINTGRATALDIQNNALTAGQALANLANANYNTQRAIGEAYANADQQDLANRLQVAQFNLGIDQANANLSQAEQAANIERANRIAAARIQDAAMREQLQQAKGQAFDKTSNAAVQGVADLVRQNMEWDWIKKNPQYAEAVKALAQNGGMLTRKKRRK